MADQRNQAKQGNPQFTPGERAQERQRMLREQALDKTLADSFPSSDPPSSIPDPEAEDRDAA